jgi:hypothetical protein
MSLVVLLKQTMTIGLEQIAASKDADQFPGLVDYRQSTYIPGGHQFNCNDQAGFVTDRQSRVSNEMRKLCVDLTRFHGQFELLH